MRRTLLLASLLLLLSPLPSHAQTPVAIEGLQVIAERQYAIETSGNIDTSGDGVFMASARVYLFTSPDQAETTWETLVAAESVQNDLPEDDDSITYEQIELEDVGDRAMVLSLSAELSEGESAAFRTAIVQKGAMIVTVTAIAGSVESAEIADVMATAMIAREPGDDEVEYDGTGASIGGVWDVFLPADAEVLGGLIAYADKETRPA